MTPVLRILAGWQSQRGFLFPWAPVMLALGIALFFGLSFEPGVRFFQVGVGVVVAGFILAALVGEFTRPLVAAVVLIAMGFILAGVRAHQVAAPVLEYRYYGPIQGTVVKVDRSNSDKPRLTLEDVVMSRMSPTRTPYRVRVSMHGLQGYLDPKPGMTVILTGHLSPPSGPVEPGGFDFQRMAWFDRLGAVGYTRTPVLLWEGARPGQWHLILNKIRNRIAAAVQRQMPGEDGAFAAAIMTGDRSGMGQGTLDALRASNLAHLLAISGLHMGLLTGVVFTAVRIGLALFPYAALRWPTKKIAALVAMAAGAFYLALSGGNVATERAFVMVSVVFVSVLFDRRALTLRAVAFSAVIILAFRPETLAEPGFQMSFSATTALVAVFGWLREYDGPSLPKWARPIAAVVISSAVAGFATAPVAAAHFNRIADYGLIANLLSVPLMGLVVMPGAVLAAVLAPLGLDWIGLAIMKPAIHWILTVAHTVSGAEGAVTYVPSPDPLFFALFPLGSLFLVLWQGRARFVGVIPVLVAFYLWAGVERPAVLISDSAGLVGVLSPEGRVLNKAKGDGFAAQSWLENDGDGVDQETASTRDGFSGAKGTMTYLVGDNMLVHLTGRGAAERVADHCKPGLTLVVAANLDPANHDCTVLDRSLIADTGAIALFQDEKGLRLVGTRAQTGYRLWNSRDVRREWDQ